MKSIIKNNKLTAVINHHGAELSSLKNSNGIEFIWQADKAIWGRHAPVLFPVVGKLRDDSYTYEDKKYSLPQHGFARDKDFKIINILEDEIKFSLKSDEEVLKKYPFEFELQINYKLHGNKLTVAYTVINNDEIPMPFSIGAHPGFSCPIGNDEKFEDYEITFSAVEILETALLQNGLFNGERKLLSASGNSIQLDAGTFANDALVFENLQSEFVSLCSTKTKHFVKMSIKGFPYLGIWSKPGAHFVCLEPWFGKADSTDENGNILNKAGINIINSQQIFHCSYEIEVG